LDISQMSDEPTALWQELETLRATLRMTEDRLLRLETVQSGLSDKHEELRDEVRSEIKSLRNQISELKTKIDDSHKDISDKFVKTNSKLDKLFGARAVVTTLITLLTSILGSGAVHLAFSVGMP